VPAPPSDIAPDEYELLTDRVQIPDEAGQPEPTLNTIQMGFLCPHGFEPAAFMIVAIDRQGKHFTNAPPQEALALRLGTIAIDYVSQRAVLKMQAEALKKSPIITAPAGSIPPFPGPAGRG